jgi:hypothetical protein
VRVIPQHYSAAERVTARSWTSNCASQDIRYGINLFGSVRSNIDRPLEMKYPNHPERDIYTVGHELPEGY